MGVVRVALVLLALSTMRAAAVTLLNPVHDLPTVVADPNGGGGVISRSWSGVTVSSPVSSKIVKARCVVPSNAK